MKKLILMSGLVAALAAAQVANAAADKDDKKPTCPPTETCPRPCK